MEESHYEVLGLLPSATTEQIRSAYKEKALLHHPDRGGDAHVWEGIQLAFDTLADVQKRAVYDRTRANAEAGAERQFAQKFREGAFDLSAPSSTRGRKGGMSIMEQLDEVKQDEARVKVANSTAVIQSGYQMSHSAGFDAWLRNQQGLGNTGFYNSEDLVRLAKTTGEMGIEATDSAQQQLPPLTATAIKFDAHGPADEVLYVDDKHELPTHLGHSEVLVYMLASPVNDEDLLRVQTPLTVLNDFPPFNRTRNKWEEIPLPAVAGVEGVGIVVATAKNVGKLHGEQAKVFANLPGMAHQLDDTLEVKDWVIALPDARLKPIGSWSSLCVCDASRLLKVPAQLLPVQHYACSRSLCTAYRLLEDYGNLRPGDTIIQNMSDLPVGQAVIQLCSMLKIRSICLVNDDDGFERTKELLMQLGATHVLRDNSKLSDFLDALGSEMPRLALDCLGGEAGKRLAIALRPGGTLVLHQLQSGKVPVISPSILMYQQISIYGFNLAQWTSEHGKDAYLQMLRTLAELVSAERLKVFTKTLPIAELNGDSLTRALASHRAKQDSTTFRERTVIVFGDEVGATRMYFELNEQIRALDLGEDEIAGVPLPSGALQASRGSGKASTRWEDAQALLMHLNLEQYIDAFVEEEMTSIQLLEEIAGRAEGEKELMEALKEMGVKKMGHRQSIVAAIVGRI